MPDKNTIIKAAQKFALSGHIDAAIAEWSKLIDVTKDGNIHNTIGDLYLKKGDQNEAVGSFAKAANIFREEGFYPKAIALNKKILNIFPHKLDARITLAELNAERGFNSQAAEDLIKIADKLVADSETEKALEVYEKALRATPMAINIRIKIADLSNELGQRERALNGFSLIASEYLDKGEPDSAKEFYNKVIEIDPMNTASLIGLSSIAEGANNINQALQYLSTAVSLSPDDRTIMCNYANLAIKADKIDEAENTLLKLIETDPSDTDAKKLLGTLYIKAGQIENAWEELEPYINMAVDRKNWTEALALLNDFMEINSMPVRQSFIDVYKGKGDNELLIIELKKLAGLYEKQGSVQEALQTYKELGELVRDKGETEEKILELEKSLSAASQDMRFAADTTPELEGEGTPSQHGGALSADYFTAKKTEADFYALQGMQDEAITIYVELNAAFPGNEEIESSLNALKLSGAEVKKAETEPGEQTPTAANMNAAMSEILQDIDSTNETAEVDYEAHFQSGINYRREGLLDEAVRELQTAVKDPEKTARNSRMLALCYMEKGSYDAAAKEFKKVIDTMSPDDTGYFDVLYELAEAYFRNKDYNSALKAYNEIHSQDPTFRDVSQKLKELSALIIEAADTPELEPEPKPKPEQTTENKIKSKKSRISYL